MATTIGTATEKGKAQAEEQAQQPKGERKPQRQRRDDKFKIFSGTANEALADEICNFLGMPRAQAHLTRFSDGEVYVQILENVRGADVFVVQPTCFPVDQHLLELLLMIDALKRASARRITPVIPYFGYARQDRKDKPRVPVPSKLVKTADALLDAGAVKVYACASHPVLSGPAIERISHSRLEQVIVTNTIPLTSAGKNEPKIKVLSIAGLVARAIQSIH